MPIIRNGRVQLGEEPEPKRQLVLPIIPDRRKRSEDRRGALAVESKPPVSGRARVADSVGILRVNDSDRSFKVEDWPSLSYLTLCVPIRECL